MPHIVLLWFDGTDVTYRGNREGGFHTVLLWIDGGAGGLGGVGSGGGVGGQNGDPNPVLWELRFVLISFY